MNRREIACSTSYQDVRGVVIGIASEFHKKYGGDFGEWIAESNYFFMVAYETYIPSKSSFKTYVTMKVWRGLMSNVRAKAFKTHWMKYADFDTSLLSSKKTSLFDLQEFMGELSDDAKCIVKMIVEDTPIDLKMELLVRDKGETPYSWKVCLQRFLKNIGWTSKRITESFSEIGRALR